MSIHLSSPMPTLQDGRRYDEDNFASSTRISSTRPDNNAPAGALSIQDRASQPPTDQTIKRRNIVFPDPVAFRYLEGDACVKVVERRSILRGYELYLVEQWACSRQSPTLVVVTFTGDESHSVVVDVLSVPADEGLWSTKLRIYFKAANQFHARPKETDLGQIMVTNLSSFPSALTVIPVPDGDIRKRRHIFIVNEDLKRLGCSGRSGLTLTEPTEATQAKFQQLYKTSDRVPILQAVMELTKLCQVALYLFEKLEHEYIDGLLCDITERAISNWWTEVGVEHYNFEPTDGILGPSTVAALLGMLMGARNRLHWYGAPVSKDVFDVESIKRGISYFQKSQKLERTRRLDRQTLFRLQTATAKAAAGDGWGVQRAVKSTMTEIGGKRGEMVMGMVSGRDKAGPADIETLDIDVFVSLAYGDRPKWLWHGKPRKVVSESQDHEKDMGNMFFRKPDANELASKRSHSLPIDDELEAGRREDVPASHTFPLAPATSVTDGPSERDALHKTVFKSVAGKMSDARSGLGRIKDAVGGGRRGHASRPSITKEDFAYNGTATSGLPGTVELPNTTPSTAVSTKGKYWRDVTDDVVDGDSEAFEGLQALSDTGYASPPLVPASSTPAKNGPDDIEGTLQKLREDVRKDGVSRAPSVAQSVVDENDLQGPLVETERKRSPVHFTLSRRQSCNAATVSAKHTLNENRWPRRMSFGDAEEAVLTWDEVIDVMEPSENLATILAQAEVAEELSRHIEDVTLGIEPWVLDKIKKVDVLNDHYDRAKTELQELYQHLSEACLRVRYNSAEILDSEREQLTESIKEIESLMARLEYEINSLVGKVTEIEDGIHNFETQVEDVEKRADGLKEQLETESWPHWFVRTLTGVGMGPNITRSTR